MRIVKELIEIWLNEVCNRKMPNHCFPSSNHWAVHLFQLIHLDLKSFPVLSYYRQGYLITFYNDFTSYTLVSMLITKDKAIQATKHFLAFIKNQYHTSVQLWMSDSGREYKFRALKGTKGTISLVRAKDAVLGPNCMLKSLWEWIKNEGIKKRI